MAVDMFLKLEGIKGEAKDDKHKHEIDVIAWSWAASNAGSAHSGGGAGAGKVHFEDISVTKWVDLSTIPIQSAVGSGKHIAEATITVRKAGEKPLEYLIVTMYEVFVTSFSTGGSGGEDRLTETITLNFGRFKTQYKEQADTGGAGASPELSFNIAAHKQE